WFKTNGNAVDLSTLTNINGRDLYVSGGVQVDLPQITEVVNTDGDMLWQTSGVGSVLSLPKLTSIQNGTERGQDLRIQALGGGRVELTSVLEIIDPATGDARGRSVEILARGANSQINLSSLEVLKDHSSGTRGDGPEENTRQYSEVVADSGGWIQFGKLAYLSGVYLFAQDATVSNPTNANLVILENTVVSQGNDGNVDILGSLPGTDVGPHQELRLLGQSQLLVDPLVAVYGAVSLGDDSKITIDSSLQFYANSFIETATSSSLAISGNWLNDSTRGQRIDGILKFNGEANSAQRFEVAASDMGDSAGGFNGRNRFRQIEIAGGARVELIDEVKNHQDGRVEGLYVDSLIVSEGSELNLAGKPVYSRATILLGQLVNGTIATAIDSGPITINTPTSGEVSIVGEEDEWSFYAGKGREYTVVANPYSLVQPAAEAPYVNSVSITILNDQDEIVATAHSVQNRQAVKLELSGIEEGNYRIRLRAGPGQELNTGRYMLSVWDSTTDNKRVEFGNKLHGTLETPYSIDQWTFVGSQGDQVRLDLLDRDSPHVKVDLLGPNGWVGFESLTSESDLINLPANGSYTLRTSRSAGLSSTDYVMRLARISRDRVELGQTIKKPIFQTGQAQLFEIHVGDALPLQLNLADSSELNRHSIYVRFGQSPTRVDFDYRTTLPSAQQQLIVPRAYPGTWYVLVYSDRVEASGELMIRADTAPVVLSGSSPARMGNGVDGRLTISGSGFSRGTRVVLASEHQSFTPLQVAIDSFTQITATIAAESIPPGVYSIRVIRPDGTADELPDALKVTEGAFALLETRIIAPAALRFRGVGQIIVEYSNTGDVAMPAPLLDFRGDQNGTEGALLTLDASLVTRGFWTSAVPEGFSHSVQFLASGDVPGILQAGETRQVTIHYAGWKTPWQTGVPFTWTVNPVYADNAVTIDWPSIKDSLRPASIGIEGWEPIFQNFSQSVGETWGDYVRMLGENANYLHRLGRQVHDVGELTGFEVQQAIGISPVTTLASATDVNVLSPGLNIQFQRSYRPSLASRNEIGPLGYGWSWDSVWEQRLDRRSDGTLIISRADGLQRVFQPDSRTSRKFLAAPGDQGIVSQLSGGRFSITESDGTRIQFNASGQVESVTDLNGNSITAERDHGLIVRLSHSSGAFLDFDYYSSGRIASLIDSAGQETHFTYDASHEHLISVRRSDGSVTEYAYETGADVLTRHALTKIEVAGGPSVEFAYDAQGRIASVKQGADQAIAFAYDAFGTVALTMPASQTAPGGTFEFQFDSGARLARTEDQLGNALVYHYDAIGHLSEVVDAEGRATQYAYDHSGNLTDITDALGATLNFAYAGPLDRMTEFTDSLGRTTSYGYTPEGNLAAIVYADGSKQSWTYDAFGNTVASTNARGQTIQYAYNAAGQITQKLFPDGTSFNYGYDSSGNLIRAEGAGGIASYDYDSDSQRLVKISDPQGHTLSFTYDLAGRRASSTDQTGYRLGYSYDAAGRLQQIADSNGSTQVRYDYDESGFLSRKTLGNGVYTSFRYDANGQLLSLENTAPDHSLLSRFDYTYDSQGMRTSMRTLEGLWSYEYDDLGQLTKWVNPQGRITTIVYDAAGNRVSVDQDGETTRYATNELNQYTDVAGVKYYYDADGNLARTVDHGQIKLYAYDAENRLISVSSDTSDWSNLWDALGNRVGVTEDGETTHFVIDPVGFGNVVGEYSSNGQMLARNVHGYGLISNGLANPNYYSFDALGSTSNLTDHSGASIAQYSYTPFGQLLGEGTETNGASLFVGEFGIVGSGDLNFMRARHYDASLGRFTQRDPIGLAGGDANLFRYVGNSPTNAIDPSGLHRWYTYVAAAIPIAALVVEAPVLILGAAAGAVIILGQGYDDFGARPFMQGAVQNLFPLVGPAAGPLYDAYQNYESPPPVDPRQQALWEDLVQAVLEDLEAANKEKCKEDPGRYGCSSGNSRSVLSQDPNEKTGPAGYGEQNFVAAGETLPYKIEFENDKEATAPAQRVDIIDQLSPLFDWDTFQLTSVAFGDTLISIKGGPQHYSSSVNVDIEGFQFQLDIEIGLESDTGQVYASFVSVDGQTGLPPSALAGFLPPEDGTGRGQGYFTYTIAPIAGLPSGTEITNIALITFDHFETIATDQIDPHDPSQGTDPRRRAPVTLDAAAPESHVESLPATVPTTFTVSWSGSDDTGGAGVAAYDIFVSENDAPFTIWIRNTAETSADFTGEPGQQYAFYSLAIDGVGHREVKDQVAEVQTTVSADSAWHNASLPLDVNADQLVTPIDALIIINALNQLGSGALSQINLTQHFYYDTNADDLLSPMDVLLIINWLNKQSPAEGESAGANAVESVSRNNYRPTGMPTFAPKQANTFAAPIEDLNNKNRFSDWDAFFDELGASADSF
ncbi:MAG: hypothetical protein IT422_29625, partial [Pirellulaceae bacterium]|nr:hypothetical protein [Pirellulaceae bacterium]